MKLTIKLNNAGFKTKVSVESSFDGSDEIAELMDGFVACFFGIGFHKDDIKLGIKKYLENNGRLSCND